MKDNRHLMDEMLLHCIAPCEFCRVLDHEWVHCTYINQFIRYEKNDSLVGYVVLESIRSKNILNHHDGPRIASKLAILELSK